jgi:hypothetical protein
MKPMCFVTNNHQRLSCIAKNHISQMLALISCHLICCQQVPAGTPDRLKVHSVVSSVNLSFWSFLGQRQSKVNSDMSLI